MSIANSAIEVFWQECVESIFEVLTVPAVLGEVTIEAGHFGGDAPLSS
jgi:hypothetical protein